MEDHFSFIRHFPAQVYSCSAGARKPDPAIYRRAIRELGVPAGQVLYIDDEPKYVQAGRQAGVQAMLFEGPQKLRGELRRRGIL
jgi:putative hydrolase of the HAD superfamily